MRMKRIQSILSNLDHQKDLSKIRNCATILMHLSDRDIQFVYKAFSEFGGVSWKEVTPASLEDFAQWVNAEVDL